MVTHCAPRRCRAGLLVAALLVGVATGIGAQKPPKAPKRPHLRAEEDTNSATAYYAFGINVLDQDADAAAAAFYWAARLDPSWGAPLYGQAAAQLLGVSPWMLTEYITGGTRVRQEPLIQQIDSLSYLALMKNPFVERRFDATVLSAWVSRTPNGRDELGELILHDRRLGAWVAYTRGDYKTALAGFDEAIKHNPDDLDMRFWKSRTFFALGMMDSARTTMQAALGLVRNAEENSGRGWVSHTFSEYSIGFLFELTAQDDSARQAYEHALLEDVSFHPAHYRLAGARLAARDTAGALAEYAQAASLAPRDASYLYDLEMLLLRMGRSDSGVAVLLEAAAVEPYYALPWPCL